MNARVKQPVTGEAEVVPMPTSNSNSAVAAANAPATAEAPRPAQPSPGPAAAPPAAAAPEAPKKRRGVRRIVLMVVVPLILVVGGGYFWLTGGRYEDTDNAYVQQPKVSLSADISGKIVEVDVKENQTVKAGDPLFKIDPEPYKIALAQADAALAQARLSVEQMRVALTTAQTKLASDQATLDIQQRSQARKTELATQGVATQSAVDQGALALQQAQSTVEQDKQAVQSALAALGGDANIKTDDVPAVRQAQAADDLAKRNLAKTTVVAPADGVISQVESLNVGQFVNAGTTIVSMVGNGATWVEANFKETQLEHIKPGQPADVKVDTYPGTTLHGTVESIGAATGAEFSLIPAQNATGNWVKVVQRIPVRIKVTANPDEPLRTGMSATVTVDTGKSTLDKLMGH
jgi:membrane fusion protein (multidrug efflux system)